MAKKTEKSEEKVMAFVEKELGKNPDIKTSDLHDKAKSVDASIGKLTLRQFNARFPLQVKRKQRMTKGRRRKSRASTPRGRARAQGNRDAVREVFVRFATDLSKAEQKPDLVRVLAAMDRYVDDAIKAASR
jgi:hypothetical protein